MLNCFLINVDDIRKQSNGAGITRQTIHVAAMILKILNCINYVVDLSLDQNTKCLCSVANL